MTKNKHLRMVLVMGKNDVVPVDAAPVENRSPCLIHVELVRAKCNAAQAVFAEEWAQGGNKAKAYRRAMRIPESDPKSQMHWTRAVVYSNMPEVLEYYDALRALAAENAVVNIQQLIERDMRVVAADDANAHAELTRYVWLNCRYCWGVGGAYQWVDDAEYQAAIVKWFDACAAVKEGERAPFQPHDTGGYGFSSWNEPREDCPQCKGLGEQRAIVADTTKLEGAAAVLYRGIKQTASGIEVLVQDTEKARDRLYKATGLFKDSAADIAKGAAAGAAAGAAFGGAQAAARTAVVAESMTDEQAARMYLELAG